MGHETNLPVNTISESNHEYNIEVCRVGYSYLTFSVVAETKEIANMIALDMAGNYEFTEKSAEYTIE